MNCNYFSVRSSFVFFVRAALIALSIVYLSLAAARAQDATPTPLPSPSPIPTVTPLPSPTVSPAPTPPVADKQETEPENLSGVPTIAPQFRFEDRSLPDLGRVGVDMMLQRPLSLREALELALTNNKDIEVSRQNTRIAEFDFGAANGFYEPRLTGGTFFERATVPNVTPFNLNQTAITTNGLTGNLRLEGTLRRFDSGTRYSVDFNNSRLGTNNNFSILNPQFQSTLTFGVAQPLFRGRRIDQARRSIEISRRNLALSDAQFRQRSIEVITNVQRAYWDLTFALKNLQVQRDAVRDAKEQLESNRRRVQEGLLAPIDVVAVETQVANFESNVYDALNQVTVAENNLKNLIAANRNDELWNVAVIPTDSVEVEPPNVSLPDALAEAVASRPELEQNTVARDINQIDQRFLRDQTRPQIDLAANYTLAGIAGVQNPNFAFALPGTGGTGVPFQLPPQLAGNFFNSLTDIGAFRYPTIRIGVQVDLPFRNETAKANLGRNLVEGERLNTQREQLEQAIQVDVRNALQFVRTAQARLRAAAIARETSEQQYASENRKFESGQSTIFLVLERQTQLSNARAQELRAQTDLNKAIADLQRATGNSLRANNIVARVR